MTMVNRKPRLDTRAGWLIKMILIGVSIIVSLILAEVVVRVFFPQRLFYNVSQWDPDVGFTPIPNIHSVQRNYEYKMTIQINSRGLRDQEFPFIKPPRTIRIGVFGDSFTFGEGVESEQTYPKLLEQLFAKDPGLAKVEYRVEVLNFGIAKTGTSHQFAWYRKEGIRYQLDIVMLAFFAYNDFYDNLSGVFKLSGGELVHEPSAYSSVRRIQSVVYAIPGYRWLAENSHLVNLARLAATILDDRRRMEPALQAIRSASGEQLGYAVELTLRLVEVFASEAKANGSKFLMLYFPARDQHPLAHYYHDKESIEPYISSLAILQDRLIISQLEQIDFLPVFAKLPSKNYYYQVDAHWRPTGHEVVARLLFQRLAGDIYALVNAQQMGARFQD